MAKKGLKAIDLFAGAGGLSLGLELAGIEVVGSVEHCPKAVTTYRHNFPSHVAMCKDITDFPPEEMEKELLEQKQIKKNEIDIIAGGPPCPGFRKSSASCVKELMKNGLGGMKKRINYDIVLFKILAMNCSSSSSNMLNISNHGGTLWKTYQGCLHQKIKRNKSFQF